LKAGIVTIFCPGANGGVTTIEYEGGLLGDIQQLLDEIIPPNRDYLHGLRSGEDNGHSHLRATLIGPSLTIPFSDGKLILGKWQQIVFLDFDTRPRSRSLIAQIIGE
jgi:secondary thiamine-phosphate synthase enzyme